MFWKILVWAFLTAFVVSGAKAREIELGTGVVCDTQAQIERFAQLSDNSGELEAKLHTINADAPYACALMEVAYYRGKSHGQLHTAAGTVEVVEILVVGFKYGTWNQLTPTIQWTIFPVIEEGA